MEEAYRELYQQFILLRSLCLKQAAMLHQLTSALEKQQGASVPVADVSELMSIPVQHSHAMLAYPHEKPQSTPEGPAEHCGIDHISRNVRMSSNLLAENMSNLSVNIAYKTKDDMGGDSRSPQLFTLDSMKSHGSLNSESQHPKQNPTREHGNLLSVQMPVTDPPAMCGDSDGGHFCQSSGVTLSEMVLQSHVCEFCEAIFPGNTTTRGEFLQHLHTHVT